MCKIMNAIMAQRRNVIHSTSRGKETIHSGHFMVSHFEADAQDDEYEVAVPVPEVSSKKLEIIPLRTKPVHIYDDRQPINSSSKMMSVSIETSLTKLFQCMSIAYRQKLTSPKWNRFKGVRLRWKEKIRLNNVIWRCWHMQFVMKKDIGVCQFASPLDVDTHSKPEAVVLEGKYWKRKLSAVTAEYKRWRIFYQKLASSPIREPCEGSMDLLDWNVNSACDDGTMMIDEDYMDFMSDTLFSTITANQPFPFPDTREIARAAGIADFIQPSLVQLQPNLDDYMDMLEPLQDLLSPPSKLPSVPEEYHPSDDLYRSLNVNYEGIPTSSFYPHSSSATISTATTEDASSGQKQMYVKMEHEQPRDILNPSSDAGVLKSTYRNNGMYIQSNSNISSAMYSAQNATTSQSYPTHNYHHLQQSNQQDVINYSHSMNKTVAVTQSTMNYNQSSTFTNCHYPNYESSPSCYNPAQGQGQGQGYSPSFSNNYKILPTSRSNRSVSVSMQADDELFVTPKLSQRGRSRSGSNLIPPQNRYPTNNNEHYDSGNCALLTQLLTNPKHYNYTNGHHGSNYVGSAPNPYNPSSGHDMRTCFTLNGHRQVAHCTALLGRRSRTPDHILSSYSNSVGYCKPRAPVLSSQNCHEGSLINLSGPSRGDTSSSKPPYAKVTDNNAGHQSSSAYNRHAQCTSKYPNSSSSSSSTPFHSQLPWVPVLGATHNSKGTTSSSSPYVFTGNQQSLVDMSGGNQIMNNSSTPNSPKYSSSPSTSDSLSLSPLTVSSPVCVTPTSPTNNKSHSSTPYKEHRRVCHINAEQKRRCNIKNGFDTLHQLIPILAQNPNTKMSKAAMLQKGAEYIRTLRGERGQLRDEIESLKQQVENLNSSISNCQSLLPATGAPVSRHKADKMKEMYDDYVRERTQQNWKFWILSLICEPLLSSFNSSVSNTSIEELFRTTIQWAEQYCSLVDLRPIVLNALRHVCTTTDILSNPNQLPEEARTIVLNSSRSINKN